jgi:hypothetical protein
MICCCTEESIVTCHWLLKFHCQQTSPTWDRFRCICWGHLFNSALQTSPHVAALRCADSCAGFLAVQRIERPPALPTRPLMPHSGPGHVIPQARNLPAVHDALRASDWQCGFPVARWCQRPQCAMVAAARCHVTMSSACSQDGLSLNAVSSRPDLLPPPPLIYPPGLPPAPHVPPPSVDPFYYQVRRK